MFHVLAKLFWPLLQPSALIVIVLLLGVALLYGRRLEPARWLLTVGLFALLVCGYTPLSDLLVRPLENRFPRADLERGAEGLAGLIVLGGGEDGRASPPREIAGLNEAAERYTEAVALWRRYPHLRVVLSGGSSTLAGRDGTEAERAVHLLTALGVPQDRIIAEGRSRSTHENATFTADLLKPKPGERWLLVTSGWHMPRAIGCFRRAGFDAIEAWPVDYRTAPGGNWNASIAEGLRRMDFVVREYAGLGIYYLSGRIPALFPAP